MGLANLLPKIFGWIVVIIVLALAPSIQTANQAIVTSGNITLLTGMSAITPFGDPIIILGLIFSGVVMGVMGLKGKMQGASTQDMMVAIGTVIVVIVVLSLFDSVVDYIWALQNGATGFAQTIYRMLGIIFYVGIIGSVAVTQYRAIRSSRGKKSRAVANY